MTEFDEYPKYLVEFWLNDNNTYLVRRCPPAEVQCDNMVDLTGQTAILSDASGLAKAIITN